MKVKDLLKRQDVYFLESDKHVLGGVIEFAQTLGHNKLSRAIIELAELGLACHTKGFKLVDGKLVKIKVTEVV